MNDFRLMLETANVCDVFRSQKQGCVMSAWLFNVYMDVVVPEVNVRVLGKRLQLLSANGGRLEIN